MRAVINLTLVVRFFLGPLTSFFLLFTFVVSCIFSLFLAIDSYEYQLEKRFSSKQPHFTLSLNNDVNSWHDFERSGQLNSLKVLLNKQKNIVAVSEFLKVTKWLRLKAATSQLSGYETKKEFDKFSSGVVTLIGLERKLPAVIPLTQLNYYDSGTYKFKITNLEYAADWVINAKLVLPNAVLDASFFAPITQEVSVRLDNSQYQAKVKAFINDYNDESVLYMGIEQISAWLDDTDIKEKGLYVRINDGRQLEQARKTIIDILDSTNENWLLTTWLDEKNKQKTILWVTKVLGYSLIGLLVMMLLLILSLNQANVFIKKAKSLNILYMTGYLLTVPLTFTSLLASILGVMFAYTLVYIWIKPVILNMFAITVNLPEGTAWMICLITVVLINVLNWMGMKNRLGY